jgi:hypothetical protein
MKKPNLLPHLAGIILILFVINSCESPKETESVDTEEYPSYIEEDTLSIAIDSVVSDTALYFPTFPDSSDMEEPVYLDTTPNILDTVDIEKPATVDTPSSMPDTISPTGETPNSKSATLGYSYPLTLKKGEIGDINVKVEIKNPNSTLRDQLKNILISQSIDHNPKGDTIVIYSENIPFYKELNVTLSDDAKDFEIATKHLHDTQVIDSVSGNSWHWTIIPKTDKKKAQLMLKIVATDVNDNARVFEPKRIFINIKLDNETGLRRLINYLWDNPAVSLPILISLSGFIGFLIRRSLNEGNSEGK